MLSQDCKSALSEGSFQRSLGGKRMAATFIWHENPPSRSCVSWEASRLDAMVSRISLYRCIHDGSSGASVGNWLRATRGVDTFQHSTFHTRLRSGSCWRWICWPSCMSCRRETTTSKPKSEFRESLSVLENPWAQFHGPPRLSESTRFGLLSPQ